MTVILEEFEDNYRNGVSLRQTPISGEYEMRLSAIAIISDWPEAASYTLAYKSANSHHPSHTCLVTRDKLNAIGLLLKYMLSFNEMYFWARQSSFTEDDFG